MKNRFLHAVLALTWGALSGWVGAPAARAQTPDPKAAAAMTVVLFNDLAPDSERLARIYAKNRQIPDDHLIPIRCVATETISRADYERDLAAPLRAIFVQRGWWKLRAADHPAGRVEASSIHFAVLMRGIPLRIDGTPKTDQDKSLGPPPVNTQSAASVDSELTALGVYGDVIFGAFNNPYYESTLPIADAQLPALLLVCRLDAPTPEVVERMMADSLAAEKNRLRGFAYVDARGLDAGNPHFEGDRWLLQVAADARKSGSPVIYDNGPGVFPNAYPMSHAALYFGWYTENVTGPMERSDFRFEPGAIAVHLHSFSASTLRDPKRNWCAPLLMAGAAATLGNVAEPYLTLTPNLGVFHARLRQGFTFGESAWMSERVLSWMTTCVGDPLYRPFPKKTGPAFEQSALKRDEWDAFAAGSMMWQVNAETGTAALEGSAQRLKSGLPLEGLGLLQLTGSKVEDAMGSFAKARQLYKSPADILRVTIHEVIQLRAQKKTEAALLLTRKQLSLYPNAPGAGVLRGFEDEMAPPPPPKPPVEAPAKPRAAK